MIQQITPFPAPPQPSDSPIEFDQKAFALLGGLPQFVDQANALGGQIFTIGEDATESAAAALASKNAAATSASNSAGSANASGQSASNSASSANAANQSRIDAQNAAEAAAASAESVDTAYLLNRANHTGSDIPIEISAPANCNDLKNPGTYSVSWSAGNWADPDTGGSLIVTKHSGFIQQVAVLAVSAKMFVRAFHAVSNAWGLWQEMATAVSVTSAISLADTYTAVPVTYKGRMIVVTLPHLRFMVWNGTKYVRAPWHQPGTIRHVMRGLRPGELEVRADVTLQAADFPDLAEYLGVVGSTFVLDEARGEFIRNADSGRGKDAGRVVGSHQGDAGRNLSGTMYSTWNGLISGAQLSVFADGAFKPTISNLGASGVPGEFSVAGSSRGLTIDASRQWPTANEFRVTNLAYRLVVTY